jgi:hypothetical protein
VPSSDQDVHATMNPEINASYNNPDSLISLLSYYPRIPMSAAGGGSANGGSQHLQDHEPDLASALLLESSRQNVTEMDCRRVLESTFRLVDSLRADLINLPQGVPLPIYHRSDPGSTGSNASIGANPGCSPR